MFSGRCSRCGECKEEHSGNQVRHTQSHNECFSLTLVKCADCNVERSSSRAPRSLFLYSECSLQSQTSLWSHRTSELWCFPAASSHTHQHNVNVVVLSQIPPNPSEMITSVKITGFSTGHISMATERLFFRQLEIMIPRTDI